MAAEKFDPVVGYLDEDQYQTHKGIADACREAGVPFIAVYGVDRVVDDTRGVNPALAQYCDLLDSNNTEVVTWEQIMTVIKSGDLPKFTHMCEIDPGLATRVGIDALGTTPVHVAASYGPAMAILYWLLDVKHVPLDARSKTGRTPLDYAIINCNIDAIKVLLAHGCDPNTINPNVLTPYLEGVRIPDEAVQMLFHIMDLLPDTLPWDKRWLLLRKQMATTTAPAAAAAASAPPLKIAKEDDTCIMCMAAKADTIVIPCRHKVVCKACSTTLKLDKINAKICIYCRQPIEGVWVESDDKLQE